MDPSRPELIPNPAVRRLSLYLRQLEAFKRKDRRTVSSKQLGESLNLTDAQVRKDLAYFGQFGHPGIGYRVDDLIAQVKRILGTDKTWNVMLVGFGNLGRALASYRGFDAKGFRLVAIFDADAAKVGKKHGPLTVQSLDELAETVRRMNIRLAMLAVRATPHRTPPTAWSPRASTVSSTSPREHYRAAGRRAERGGFGGAVGTALVPGERRPTEPGGLSAISRFSFRCGTGIPARPSPRHRLFPSSFPHREKKGFEPRRPHSNRTPTLISFAARNAPANGSIL
jgi:redox-sensing transcriptional repressor